MIAPIHFAPLQGYTDAIYRETHARVFGGVETYYTPFVRLEKENFRSKDLKDITPIKEATASVVPQLIASTPDEFRKIATLFSEAGYDKADINLGCPFPLQARQHRGAGILPYKDEGIALLNTIHEFPNLTFSAKLRLGWENPNEAQELLPVLNLLPLSHITLHPRIGIQQYKGETDKEAFTHFYEACALPLFYNGDLCSEKEIQAILEQFPRLHGLMLGRGLLSTPWLAFEHRTGQRLADKEMKEKLSTFHTLLSEQYSARLEGGDHQILDKLKTLWDYLLPNAEKRLRKRILKSNSLTSYQGAVRELITEAELGM